jgi:exonuclease III
MKLATFNINNINRRLTNLVNWLREATPEKLVWVSKEPLWCEQTAMMGFQGTPLGYSMRSGPYIRRPISRWGYLNG